MPSLQVLTHRRGGSQPSARVVAPRVRHGTARRERHGHCGQIARATILPVPSVGAGSPVPPRPSAGDGGMRIAAPVCALARNDNTGVSPPVGDGSPVPPSVLTVGVGPWTACFRYDTQHGASRAPPPTIPPAGDGRTSDACPYILLMVRLHCAGGCCCGTTDPAYENRSSEMLILEERFYLVLQAVEAVFSCATGR